MASPNNEGWIQKPKCQIVFFWYEPNLGKLCSLHTKLVARYLAKPSNSPGCHAMISIVAITCYYYIPLSLSNDCFHQNIECALHIVHYWDLIRSRDCWVSNDWYVYNQMINISNHLLNRLFCISCDKLYFSLHLFKAI